MTGMQLKASKGAVLPVLSSSNLRSRSEGLLADQLHLERLVKGSPLSFNRGISLGAQSMRSILVQGLQGCNLHASITHWGSLHL